VEPLITHRVALEEAPAIFKALKARNFGPYAKILIKPNG
jgi:L-iditol 2-dehydrogenase